MDKPLAHVVGYPAFEEHYAVAVERISPEFPGVVCKSEDDVPELKDGIAVRTARQFAQSHNVYLISTFNQLPDNEPFNTEFCITPALKTTKMLVCKNTLVTHWDTQTQDLMPLLKSLKQAPKPSLVVFVGYLDHEFKTQCLDYYKALGVQTILDNT